MFPRRSFAPAPETREPPISLHLVWPSTDLRARHTPHTSFILVGTVVTRRGSGVLGGVTMTLHKLSAGSGYEYLTRQVAAMDSTEKGPLALADYYSAKGESPGRWVGSGLANGATRSSPPAAS